MRHPGEGRGLVRLNSSCVFGGVSADDSGKLGAGLGDRPGDLGRRRLDEADELCPKLVERRQGGERLYAGGVEHGLAHRPADDLEPVVGLGEIDRGLGGGDRMVTL